MNRRGIDFMIPYISGLRADIWANSSNQDKVNALGQLENYLAKEDGRSPSIISSEQLSPYIRGIHFQDEQGFDRIQLNSELISDQSPYQAVETFFHEDRHSHQAYLVQHPELAENAQQLSDWTMSFNDGYVNPNDYDHNVYRWQPTEADANEVARTNTNDLYQNTFHDEAQYPNYKQTKEQEVVDSIKDAQNRLGENYKDTARKMMINNFQSNHPEYNKNMTNEVELQATKIEIGEFNTDKKNQQILENPEEKSYMPGATSEDRTGIETLTTKESSFLENRELIQNPKQEGKSDQDLFSSTSEGIEKNSPEVNRYERGFYR